MSVLLLAFLTTVVCDFGAAEIATTSTLGVISLLGFALLICSCFIICLLTVSSVILVVGVVALSVSVWKLKKKPADRKSSSLVKASNLANSESQSQTQKIIPAAVTIDWVVLTASVADFGGACRAFFDVAFTPGNKSTTVSFGDTGGTEFGLNPTYPRTYTIRHDEDNSSTLTVFGGNPNTVDPYWQMQLVRGNSSSFASGNSANIPTSINFTYSDFGPKSVSVEYSREATSSGIIEFAYGYRVFTLSPTSTAEFVYANAAIGVTAFDETTLAGTLSVEDLTINTPTTAGGTAITLVPKITTRESPYVTSIDSGNEISYATMNGIFSYGHYVLSGGTFQTSIFGFTVRGSRQVFFPDRHVVKVGEPVVFSFKFSGVSSSPILNFGDGTSSAIFGNSVTHSYASPGVYFVRLSNPEFGFLIVVYSNNPPPTAVLQVSPSSGPAPLNVNFDFSGSSSFHSINEYVINFGDGSPLESTPFPSASHTYTSQGTYTAQLRVVDELALVGTTTAIVNVGPPNQNPVALFSATPSTGIVPLTVNVDASASSDADGNIVSYTWNWGDGTSNGTGVTNSHLYSSEGTYTLTLTVTDNSGLTDSTSMIIIATPVPNTNPTATFTASPTSGPADLTVNVNASGSSDSDGEIVSYRWSWGDGSPHTVSGTTSASHVYTVPGTYTIELTVTDDQGGTGISSQQINVTQNQAPIALFTVSPNVGYAPISITADASASKDNDGQIVSFAWDWDDGTPNGSGKIAQHVYSAAGDYAITLTVTDNKGVQSSATVTVHISERPAPVPLFSVSQLEGPTPLTVTVDASLSSDPDSTITSYQWNWGDGSPMSTGVISSHTYTTVGIFTLSLTVTNNYGLSATTSTQIKVEPPMNQAPVASFVADITSGPAPLTVNFDASASSDADGNIVSYAWNFGDGATGTGALPTHTYLTVGTFTVTLTVTDNGGATASTGLTIQTTQPETQGQVIRRLITYLRETWQPGTPIGRVLSDLIRSLRTRVGDIANLDDYQLARGLRQGARSIPNLTNVSDIQLLNAVDTSIGAADTSNFSGSRERGLGNSFRRTLN